MNKVMKKLIVSWTSEISRTILKDVKNLSQALGNRSLCQAKPRMQSSQGVETIW